MRQLTILTAGALAAAMISSSAVAWTGVATGNVNLRSEDSVRGQKLTTIPEGARVEVDGCPTWCHLTYNGITGWASSNYIATVGDRRASRVYQRAPRVYYERPAPRAYYHRDPYAGSYGYSGRYYDGYPGRYNDRPYAWGGHPWRHRPFGGSGFGVYFGF